MDESSYFQRNTQYYQDRHCSVQWQRFLATLLAGLAAGSGVDTMLEFFRSLGRDMAKDLPVPEQDTLEGLEAAINTHWAAMDWGWCHLSVAGIAISIVHGAWPRISCSQPELAGKAIGAVLSGIYGHWLEQQGGVRLQVIVLRSETSRPLELSYGC